MPSARCSASLMDWGLSRTGRIGSPLRATRLTRPVNVQLLGQSGAGRLYPRMPEIHRYVVPSAAQPCPSNQSIRRAVAWLKSRVNATRDGFRNAAGHRCGFRGPTTPDDFSEPPTAGVGGTAVRVTRRSPPRAPVRRSMSTLRPSSLTRRNAELPTGTLASTR